jgi:hypothetical protein
MKLMVTIDEVYTIRVEWPGPDAQECAGDTLRVLGKLIGTVGVEGAFRKFAEAAARSGCKLEEVKRAPE